MRYPRISTCSSAGSTHRSCSSAVMTADPRTAHESGGRALRKSFAQALRPDVGPVLSAAARPRARCRPAVSHPPSRRDVGEGRPEAVLLLVVDQDEEVAVVVVERIGAHSFS